MEIVESERMKTKYVFIAELACVLIAGRIHLLLLATSLLTSTSCKQFLSFLRFEHRSIRHVLSCHLDYRERGTLTGPSNSQGMGGVEDVCALHLESTMR